MTLAGHTDGSFDGQPHIGTLGLGDLCLTKLSNSGTTIWTRIWGSGAIDIGYGMTLDQHSNVYVTGRTKGSFDGQTNAMPNVNDACLTKFNTSGSTLWTRIWGSVASDSGQGVCCDGNGNVYVTGGTAGGFDGQTNNGADDIFVKKLDFDGSGVWTRIIGTPTNDLALSISLGSNDDIYIAAFTYGEFGGQTNAGGSDCCLVAMNTSGSTLWVRIWGSAEDDQATAVRANSNGDAYIAGRTMGSFGGQLNSGLEDMCLTKMNSLGEQQQVFIWGSTTNDSSVRGLTIRGNNLYVGGRTEGAFDGESNAGGYDLSLTKFIIPEPLYASVIIVVLSALRRRRNA